MNNAESAGGAPAGKLRALAVQLIGASDGVILVRGASSFRIQGQGAAAVVHRLLSLCMGEGATRQELLDMVSAPEREILSDLIDQLERRRLLIPVGAESPPPPASESAQEIFYWNFGAQAEAVLQTLGEKRIAVLGVNVISRQLAGALRASGATRVEVVDMPLARNLSLFDGERLTSAQWPEPLSRPVDYAAWQKAGGVASCDCLVVTSDFGGVELMREWNQVCLKERKDFLPVVLSRLTGTVGPLVVPGETACYECLWARENSNLMNAGDARAVDRVAPQAQPVSGFLPPMASILGDLAATELVKFYSGTLPYKVGALIEVKLLVPLVQAHKLLKVPRCVACSSLNRTGAVNLNRLDFLPGGLLTQEPKSEPSSTP